AVERDKRTGYMYAAQLQAGLLEAEVAAEADRFARSWVPPRLVRAARELRAACSAAGLLPVVVSASPLPIVRAAAPLAGFSELAGIAVRVRNGRFTDEVLDPVTYAEGKVQAASRFGPLIVACGDSLTGDLALLSAARISVVVAPVTGSPLCTEALRRGWYILHEGD
ncbi:MAG: HAD family hydrolase, partial [Myxococcales bacterium]